MKTESFGSCLQAMLDGLEATVKKLSGLRFHACGAHAHSHMRRHALVYARPHRHSRTHINTHAHPHTQTRRHTRTRARAHTHTNKRTNSRTLAHMQPCACAYAQEPLHSPTRAAMCARYSPCRDGLHANKGTDDANKGTDDANKGTNEANKGADDANRVPMMQIRVPMMKGRQG